MYASGNSNFFAEINNFQQELRFTAPVENGSSVEQHDTANANVSSELPNQLSFRFPSASQDEPLAKKATPSELPEVYFCPSEATMTGPLVAEPATAELSGKLLDGSGKPLDGSGKQAPGGKQRKGNVREPSVPPEEILGSVTTFYPAGNLECGQTVRTSARVKHKMRMDSIHSRTQRLQERKEQTKAVGASLAKTPNQPKQMRVEWSNHDKNLFFEALYEYGKDFEAILNYLNTKKRRKDNGEQQVFKAKDVRNLYYQFNQKVVKYVHFSDEVKKEAQELYALINYGEMRRKLPFQNKKYFHKLKDLVYKGFTVVREKGKNIRIKTPSCRALRKLNQLEEWQEEIKLPPRVDVFLRPSTVEAWSRVQSLAQNPRVRVTVTIQKRLSVLLQLFQQKWRSQDIRLLDRLEQMRRMSASVSSKLTRQRIQHEIELYSQLEDSSTSCLLRFAPAQNVIIHRPMISLTDFQSNTSICLNSYEQRIGVKVPGEALCAAEKLAACKERMTASARRQRTDSGSEKVSSECKKAKLEESAKQAQEEKPFEVLHTRNGAFQGLFKSPNASNESMELKEMDCFEPDLEYRNHTNGSVPLESDALDALTTRQSDNSSDGFVLIDGELFAASKYHPDTAESSAGEEPAKGAGNPGMTPVVASTTTGTGATNPVETKPVKKKKCHRRKADGNKSSSTLPSINHFRPLISDEEMQRIREGWTIPSVGDLTVGDLYIMFGAELKVELEYDWVRRVPVPTPSSAPQDAKTATNVSPKDNEHPPAGGVCENGSGASNTSAKLEPEVKPEEEAVGGVKDEPKEPPRTGNDSVSGRLKQLLFLVNLGNRDPKKRSAFGAADRKPKRTDNDGGCMSSHDDCLPFKHPLLAGRNNHLIPEPHINPRYRQSRWWRTRVNRLQTMQSMIPNVHRMPPTATVTSSTAAINAGASTSLATTHKPSTVVSAPEKDTVVSVPEKDTTIASVQPPPQPQQPAPLVLDTVEATKPVHYVEENASDASVSKHHTNPTSSNMPSLTVDEPAVDVLPNDLSSLSLFDLSLPSTSSAMMADIFSGPNLEDDFFPDILEQPIMNLNDLSLSQLFNSTTGEQEQPNLPVPDLDVDMSVMNENSVDYIARFQDIAAEFRAEQNP
ncbi:protein cramped [Anopheles nili]|uniref:protein cramped n=1 Tax=Anopheles nili TaxID=185578 RepID=UPI00237AC5A5|nr:protein cramped [Anopheles nili]